MNRLRGYRTHRTTHAQTCAITLDQSYALHELETAYRVFAPDAEMWTDVVG